MGSHNNKQDVDRKVGKTLQYSKIEMWIPIHLPTEIFYLGDKTDRIIPVTSNLMFIELQ